MLTENTIVSIGENQVHSNLEGESVILDLEEGVYYGLDKVGTRIWQLIDTPVSIMKIINTIYEEYDVTREQCTKDTINLLENLAQHNLIQVTNPEN